MDRWRGRERSDGWSGLSVHLVVGFWAGLTAGEIELLAGRMRVAVLRSLEQVTTVTVVRRLPFPPQPR